MKGVITSGGKATRMLPATTVIPKALLPVFKKAGDRRLNVPIVDLIISSMSDAGVSDFCVVVGPNGGHMLRDYLADRKMSFAVQPEQKGFGDAVLQAEKFVGNDPFFVHADDGVLSGGYAEAVELYKKNDPDCIVLLRMTDKPTKYGIVEVEDAGTFMDHKLFKIKGAEEKPVQPKSNIMLSAVYVFKPKLFAALKASKPGKELEITSGIDKLAREGGNVYGILLEKEKWLNVGNPESYHETLNYTYDNF